MSNPTLTLSPFNALNTRYKHLKRYQKVIAIWVKYGFGDLISASPLKKLLSEPQSAEHEYNTLNPNLTRWERIRMALEELGPAYIKLGQILSNRPDIAPEALITELTKLQDLVPPFNSEEACTIIEKELQLPISEFFIHFEKKPIASASISQVHVATLKSNRQKVVVKVQRPNIKAVIDTDLEIMHDIATIAEKYIPALAAIKPTDIVKVFEKSIKQELNFVTEATNIQQFARNFENNEEVYIPRVYKKYTTQKVLIMEYIDGIKINNLEGIKKYGNNPKNIATQGVNLYFEQIFVHGFFHADPHPGNIFLLPNGKICFLDFGMTGRLTEDDQDKLADFIIGIAQQNNKAIIKAISKIADNNTEILQNKDFERDITELLHEYAHQSLAEISGIINRIRKIIFKYHLTIPPDFYLLLKTIVMIEGMGIFLDPDFNILQHLQPYGKTLLQRKLNPKKWAKNALHSSLQLAEIAQNLPEDLNTLLQNIKNGKAQIQLEHKGTQPLFNTLERISNRITMGIVLGSLIIGSSLIVLSKLPPYWGSIPAIGVVGFLISGVLALALIFSIFKSKNY